MVRTIDQSELTMAFWVLIRGFEDFRGREVTEMGSRKTITMPRKRRKRNESCVCILCYQGGAMPGTRESLAFYLLPWRYLPSGSHAHSMPTRPCVSQSVSQGGRKEGRVDHNLVRLRASRTKQNGRAHMPPR